MEFRPSHRVQNLKQPLTQSLAARIEQLRSAGKDVLNLVSGEPAFKAPAGIREAALAADMSENAARAQHLALRDALLEKFERDNGLRYELDQISITGGCTQAVFELMQAVIDPGDEVVIPAPYWTSYPEMARLAGANPVIVRTTADHGFKMAPEQLRGVVSDKTRLVVLNSPANPSGAYYDPGELRALGAVLLEHPEVLILADDTYEHLLWTGQPFGNFLNACPLLINRTIVVNATPRLWAVGPFTVGYAAGPRKIVQAMQKIHGHTTGNVSGMAQAVTLALFRGSPDVLLERRAEIKRRHELVCGALGDLDGVQVVPAAGSMHVLADFSDVIQRMEGIHNDTQLAEYLLEQTGVAVLPGAAVGAVGCLRLSCAAEARLAEALQRLVGALAASKAPVSPA